MPYELVEDTSSNNEEGFLESGLRHGARTASRIGEQVAGLPGDIFSLINEYIAKPVSEKITGEKGLPYEQTSLGKVFPPTEHHREATKKAFGGYTEPKNEYEKFADDIVQDATALFLPGSKGKISKGVSAALAKSTGANIAGNLVQDLTADEKKGAYTKLGSLFLLSMFDKPTAAKTIGELYRPLQEQVTKLAPVNASVLENNLGLLRNKMTKGTLAQSEKFIIDEIDAILPKIQNNKITPEELWAVKRSLNEKISKILFDIPKKADQERARKLAKNILHDVDNTLKETAKQDPKFYKDLKKADRAFGVLAESHFISNAIEKNLKYTPLTAGLLHILQGPIGTKAAIALAPYEGIKVLYQISHSPELAKHYSNVIAAAAKENVATLNNEIKKLDKGLQKKEKSKKYQIID